MQTRSVTVSLAVLVLVTLPAAAGIDTGSLRHMLVQDCGSCHGLTMRGGLGPALLPQDIAGIPVEVLVNTILDGRPGTAMPPWRALLSEEEAAWMAQQLQRGLR